MMKSVIIFGFFFCVLLYTKAGQILNYSFEEYKCKGDIRIDENTEVLISYNGGMIDSICYFMNFLGRDATNMKSYQICLETMMYQDPNCAILVGLTSSSRFAEDFNCTHIPPKAICCDKFLKIHIESISSEKSSRNSSFLFKIKAHITANKMDLIRTLLAGSGGAFVFIVIIILIIRWIKSRLQNTKKKESNETECEIYENASFDGERP